jgi:chemotaxis signal transduction protein
MKLSERQLALLRRRAEQIARPTVEKDRSDVRAYLGCVVSSRRVGLPVQSVLGVFRVPPVTPVPGSGRVLRGIAQVRGQLVAVVDLAAALGEPRSTRAPLLALVEGEPGRLGVLIDRTERLVEVPSHDHCQHLPRDATEPFVSAIAQDLFALIDVDVLLGSPLVRASAARATAASSFVSSTPGGSP